MIVDTRGQLAARSWVNHLQFAKLRRISRPRRIVAAQESGESEVKLWFNVNRVTAEEGVADLAKLVSSTDALAGNASPSLAGKINSDGSIDVIQSGYESGVRI